MAFDYKPLVTNFKMLRMDPLNLPEGWEIYNLPKRIKTASIEKAHDEDLGGLDLKAELHKHPDNLYLKIFAIKENEVNDNGDCFSPEELKKAADTFIGVPIFTNHQNDDIENARGECVHAWYDSDDKGINIIARVDKIAYPKLARIIEEKIATGTSMGASRGYDLVLLGDGSTKRVDELKSGEEVVTHSGKIEKATIICRTQEHDQLYKIIWSGNKNGLALSEEHPVLILENEKLYYKNGQKSYRHKPEYISQNIKPIFTEAKNVTLNDYVLELIEQQTVEVEGINEDTAYLLGVYAAEGYISENSVGFCFGLNDDIKNGVFKKVYDILERIYPNCKIRVDKKEERNGLYLITWNESLRKLCEKFISKGSHTKKIHPELIKVDKNLQKIFLGAYLDGDGCNVIERKQDNGYSSGKGAMQCSSASKELLEGVRKICLRFGVPSTISKHDRIASSSTVMDNDLKYTEYQLYITNTISDILHKYSQKATLNDKAERPKFDSFFFKDYIAHRVKSVEIIDNNEDTFYVQIGELNNPESDHSYILNDIATHNCSVGHSCCTICHNRAETAENYCSHVKEAKNRKRSGTYQCKYHESDSKPTDDCPVCGCKKGEKKSHDLHEEKVAEWNYELKFIENSFVVNPACHSCGVTCVLHAPEVTKKIAELKRGIEELRKASEVNPRMFMKAASAGFVSEEYQTPQEDGLGKIIVAGQLELDMLKGSMDNLERVTNSMLKQNMHVDMEFVEKIVKAMKILQDTKDELTELGYAQLQSPSDVMTATTGEDMTFPKPAVGQGASATAQTPAPQPANSGESGKSEGSQGGRQDILNGLGSITSPKRSEVVNKKKELTAALTKVKESIAAVQDWIASEPEKTIEQTLTDQMKESELNMADQNNEIKTAQVSSTPEGRPEQREVITEKQLSKNPPELHPRTGKTYEQITESEEQIGRSDDASNDTTSESPQKRLGTYETTTEDQLDKVTSGYIVRAKDAPDVITEKQWDDWSRKVSAELPSDWLETITQDQLRKLLSNHTFVGTYETITEDQLKNQDLGIKRWASKSYTSTLTKVAFEAISDAIAKFKKSPDDLRRAVASLMDSPAKLTKAAQLAVINSLPFKNEERKAIFDNATYFGKVAGISENGIGTVDALILSIAENAKAGLKAEDVFETIAYSLRQKTALAKVDQMVKTKLASTGDEGSNVDKFAAINDAIESLNGYDIRTTIKELGGINPKTDKVAFLKAALKYAQAQTGETALKIRNIKVAQEAGLVRMLIDALEQVEQKMNGGGVGRDMGGGTGDVDVEFVDGGDGLGGEIENIEGALDGPGGVDDAGGCGGPEVIDDLDGGMGEDVHGDLPPTGDDTGTHEDKSLMPGMASGMPESAGAGGPAAGMGGMPMASAKGNTRTAARAANVKTAQMMGGQMGGQGGASQAPGAGGASLPQPPDMAQNPVESFGDNGAAPEGEEGADDMGEKSPKPPGSICPVCGSDDVDLMAGEFRCNNCSSSGDIKVSLEVKNWADLTSDKNNGEDQDEFGGEGFEMPEGGAPDMGAGAPGAGGAAGGAMPEVPVAAFFRIEPGALRKLAESKTEFGTVSPYTGSKNTMKVSECEEGCVEIGDMKLKEATHVCLDTGCKYTVSYRVVPEEIVKGAQNKTASNKSLGVYAQVEWKTVVSQNVCPSCNRARRTLIKALASAGISEAQFDTMNVIQKGKTLLQLKNAGSLKQIKTASKNGSIKGEFKKAFGNFGPNFPMESCREKLARRYGKNALAMSGPCEGKPLYECVCNSLKNAGTYSDGLAVKVAFAWSDNDGNEECVERLVRKADMTLREAAVSCSLLKSALASSEDMFADDLGEEKDDNGPGGGLDKDNGGPPTDIDEDGDFDDDNDPFDGDGDENGEGNEGGSEGGLPGAGGGTVTLELPVEVAEQLTDAVQQATGGEGAGIGAPGATPGMPGSSPAANPMGGPDLGGGGNIPAGPGHDPLGGGGIGAGIEVGGPAELGLDKPLTGAPLGGGQPPMGGGSKPCGCDTSKPLTANPAAAGVNPQQNPGSQEGIHAVPGVTNNLKQQGNPVMAQNDINLDKIAQNNSRVGGVGKATGMDYAALAAKLGLKIAGEKEIQQELVQDNHDIGNFSAGDPKSGKTNGQIGHEKETIRDAELPSVPRSEALMGHESENISKDNPLPKIPSDKGTMGHESEQGLSGGDVRFTGGTNAGGGGGVGGSGETPTKDGKEANGSDDIVTAAQEAELRAMRGVIGNSKDRTNMLLERLAGKLRAPEAVSEDPDTKPHSNGGTIGHEPKFTADEPTNTESSGNSGQMGHENETLGSTPKSPKDLPEVPEGGSSGSLMGHESDGDLNPEKQTKDKGTVIASSNAESQSEAFRVAGFMLESGFLKIADLQKKVAELAQYKPSQIKDYEKLLVAHVSNKGKKGLTTASEGLERPLVINLSSSMKKSSADKDLVAKIQRLFSQDEKNKEAEALPDFNLRRANGR